MTTDQHLALLELRFPDELERAFYLKTVNLLKALTDCPLIEAHYALSPHIHAIWERVQAGHPTVKKPRLSSAYPVGRREEDMFHDD